MSLKARLTADEFESLSDEVKKHYVKGDGDVYQLSVDAVGGLQLADVGKLQKALSAERTKVKDLGTQLQPYRDPESGDLIDAEAARDAMSRIAEIGDDATVDEKVQQTLAVKEKQLQDKFKGEQTQLVKKYEDAQKSLDEQNKQLLTQLQQSLVDQAAVKAIADAQGSVELLLPIVRTSARMVKDDSTGQFTVRIVDDQGTERLSQKAGTGTEPMQIAEFVERLREDERYGRAFNADGTSGSGASGESAGSKPSSRAHTLSYVDAQDPVKYRNAKAAAEKAGTTLTVQAPPNSGMAQG